MSLFTQKDLVGTKRVYEGDIINLRVDKVELSDGSKTTREVVEHNGGVVIACLTKKNDIILVKQYRYSIDQELIELPAGRIDLTEDPLLAAKRELLEETGYLASSWMPMTKLFTAPGFCNEVLHFYQAKDIEFVGKQLDSDEETEVLELTLSQAWHQVLEGEIRDTKTVAGLAMLMNDG